jgi:uncharacterized protein YciI
MTTTPSFIPSDSALTELTGDQLRARVARAKLYLIDGNPVAGSAEPPQALQREHLAHLYLLETQGRLYGSGPVESETGRPAHELTIVAAASRDEAERIAANEPLQMAGLRVNTVQAHTMNEGVACYVARVLSKRAEAMREPFDPDISAISLSYHDLAGRAAGVQLYLIALDPTGKSRPTEDAQTGIDHFVWLRDTEMQAKLMSCGPLEAAQPLGPGIWGGGLGIVATSRTEAERLASVEPSGVAGYRSLSVRAWILDYGLAAPLGKALQAVNAL